MSDYPYNDPGRDFLGGITEFFGGRDGGETFPPFGFGAFGNMDRFEEHLNDMMSRFFSDFQPESFADSQYYREDRDLDEDVGRKGLDHALQTVPETRKPHQFFSGFSHSESTITRPDGSIEKRVTHRNSDGNTSTTVTIISPDGREEVITDGSEQSYPERLLQDGDARHVPPNIDGGGLLKSIYDNFKRFF